MNREAIMSALSGFVFASASFKTTGRRVPMWRTVAEQPACFVRHIKDQYERRDPLPAKVTLHAEIWIYARCEDPNAAPDTIANPLLDAIDAALAPDVLTNRQTLGGLAYHAWIEGDADIDPGDLDSQIKIVVPICILVP